MHWYIQAFRNTPPLVQLYFFYFGLGSLLKAAGGGPLVANVTWAIVSLSFFAGAFNVEIFRSGVEAVPRTTIEAAESLGFSRLQTYLRIVFPLAFRISLPALNNNLVNLVKTTTLAYAIAVPEMLYVSSQIWSDELNVPVMMNVLLIAYFLLVGILVYAMPLGAGAARAGFRRMNGLPVLPSAARLARAALDERTAGAAPWRLRACTAQCSSWHSCSAAVSRRPRHRPALRRSSRRSGNGRRSSRKVSCSTWRSASWR